LDISQLQTFIRVSEYGSFTQAGEQSFISGTAVMKQINRLEAELNFKLFVRSATGTTLTPEGEKFLPYVRQLLRLLNTAVAESRKVGLVTQNVITVGTSILHPADPFLTLWHDLAPQLSNFRLRIIQLQEDLNSSNREYAMLGRACDLIVGTFDSTTLKQSFNATPLGYYQFGIAIRTDNPLAQLRKIRLSDLANQRILMVPTGISEKNDQLRSEIMTHYPTISPVSTTGRYDINTFNRAVADNIAMITLTPWWHIHPNLVSIPLETSLEVPYGIMTTKFAGNTTTTFLEKFNALR